jgi:hypothetical protein
MRHIVMALHLLFVPNLHVLDGKGGEGGLKVMNGFRDIYLAKAPKKVDLLAHRTHLAPSSYSPGCCR